MISYRYLLTAAPADQSRQAPTAHHAYAIVRPTLLSVPETLGNGMDGWIQLIDWLTDWLGTSQRLWCKDMIRCSDTDHHHSLAVINWTVSWQGHMYVNSCHGFEVTYHNIWPCWTVHTFERHHQKSHLFNSCITRNSGAPHKMSRRVPLLSSPYPFPPIPFKGLPPEIFMFIYGMSTSSDFQMDRELNQS